MAKYIQSLNIFRFILSCWKLWGKYVFTVTSEKENWDVKQ